MTRPPRQGRPYDRDMAILREKVIWGRTRGAPRGHAALMPTEQANVRRALHALRLRHGSAERAAKAIGVSYGTVAHVLGKRPVSAEMAIRVARAADVPVSAVLRGTWPRPGACLVCGRS